MTRRSQENQVKSAVVIQLDQYVIRTVAQYFTEMEDNLKGDGR